MRAYYNEWDSFAAAWLRELIKAGEIMEGDVDERDIWDVRPDELRWYTRVHLFAGLGGWDYALRLAGWPDDRPVWTASCPCQPFSAAGKRRGTADERHLWPAAFHLIGEVRPDVVFGEQVASKDGLAWLDLVLSDLEGAGYSAGAVDCCAAGVGAPHIRQRLWFVADAEGETGPSRRRPGIMGCSECGGEGEEPEAGSGGVAAIDGGPARVVAESEHAGGSGEFGDSCLAGLAGRKGERGDDGGQLATPERAGGGMGDAEGADGEVPVCERGQESAGSQPRGTGGACNGFWADAEWIPCRDGKARPTQSWPVEMVDELPDSLGLVRHEGGAYLSPLIGKTPNRVGRLKGYGNSITIEVARAVIESYMEATDGVSVSPEEAHATQDGRA